MIYGLVFLCLFKPFTFYSMDMKQVWTLNIFHVIKQFGKSYHIVAINRSEIPEIKSLKEIPAFKQRCFQSISELFYNGS